MNGVISTDFHSHILPRADHGSDSVETSVRQLDIVSSYGIENIVATPHFYPMRDNVDVFLKRRSECAKELYGAMKKEHPAVLLGAEVLICNGIDRMAGLDKLCIYGTNTILLEMPMTRWSSETFETIENIKYLGLVPVMAHIDRFNPKYVEQLLQLPVTSQLNPGAFFGSLGNRRLTKKWLENGLISAVGSDLHGADEKSYKDFTKAIKALGSHAGEIQNRMTDLTKGAKVMKK